MYQILIFFCRWKYKESNQMESESKTFHYRISGRHSCGWEGKTVWRGEVVVLCDMQAHNTCTSRYLQKETREQSCAHGFHSCAPHSLGQAGSPSALGRVSRGCDQVRCCSWQLLFWVSSSFAFSVCCLGFPLSSLLHHLCTL